jgi:hypothetical protein
VNKTKIERVLDQMIIKDTYEGHCLVVNNLVRMVSFVFDLCETFYTHDRKLRKVPRRRKKKKKKKED